MMMKQAAFVLRARDRTELEGILRDGNVPQKIVKRAKIVLMTADGAGVTTIMRTVGVSKTTVWRWQDYFIEAGVTGLVKGTSRFLPSNTRLATESCCSDTLTVIVRPERPRTGAVSVPAEM